jgi:acyl carrier protein
MGLDMVELVMAYEEEFGVQIPDAAAANMATPRDVIDWLVAAQDRGEFYQPPPVVKPSWWAPRHRDRCWPGADPARPKLTRDEIAAGVRQRTLDQLGIRPAQYREDARFVEDFGAD